MRNAIIILVLGVCSLHAQTNKVQSAAAFLAAPDPQPPVASLIISNSARYTQLITKDGQAYDVVSWGQQDPDGIYIRYHLSGAFGGIYPKKIPFELLPDDIQQKLGFNSANAFEFRKQVAADQETEREQANEAFKEQIEVDKAKAAQDTADATAELAAQQKRTADAIEAQARAAEVANQIASNQVPATVNNVQNNTSIIQQQQQNNVGY